MAAALADTGAAGARDVPGPRVQPRADAAGDRRRERRSGRRPPRYPADAADHRGATAGSRRGGRRMSLASCQLVLGEGALDWLLGLSKVSWSDPRATLAWRWPLPLWGWLL